MGEEKQEEKVPAEVEAGIDMSQFRVKVDHFQGVHTLGEEGALAGAPNFRQVCLAVTVTSLYCVWPAGAWLPYIWLCSAN